MTTHKVPVSELLRAISRSIDASNIVDSKDWEELIVWKIKDHTFWGLVDAIPEEGFTYPICIVRGQNGWVLGNGHHRLVAAILLGLDEVPVVFSDPDPSGFADYMRIAETTHDGNDSDKWCTTNTDHTLCDAIAAWLGQEVC